MAYNSAYTGAQVDAAVGAVRNKETTWDGKQDKLSGTNDQLVGFNSAGEATAVSKPTYTAADVGAMPAVSGGTTGQVLTKTEAGQEWQDAPDGLPEDGTEGQVLTKTPTGAQWDDVPSDIPAGGTQGQVLTKGDGETVTWSDPASGLPTGGTPGQMLYQGESGPEWGAPPESGMTQEDGDTRYLKLSGGTLTGDVYFAGDTDNSIGYQSKCIIYFEKPNSGSPFIKIQINNEDVATFYQNALDLGDIIVRGVNEPSGKTDAVNKQYVDSYFVRTTRTINSKPLSSDVTLTAEDVGAMPPPTRLTATLSSSGWSGNSQTITVTGVITNTSAQDIDISCADKASADAWAAGGVWCSNPTTANRLTFTCTTPPTANINLNIRLWEVG